MIHNNNYKFANFGGYSGETNNKYPGVFRWNLGNDLSQYNWNIGAKVPRSACCITI